MLGGHPRLPDESWGLTGPCQYGLGVHSYDGGEAAAYVSRPWMIWMAFQETADMLKLSSAEPARLNQSEPKASQLSLNFERRIGCPRQLFIALHCPINILGPPAARIATDAISIDRKPQLLIPVALLLCIEDEGTPAIVTLPLNIVVVRVQHA